jgi:hypothetical protein
MPGWRATPPRGDERYHYFGEYMGGAAEQWMNGHIWEWRMWNFAMTDTEIGMFW